MASDTMTIKEVSEALGVSVRTVHRRIAEGELKPLPKSPALKRAAALEFRRADIEKILKSSPE